MSPGRGGTAGPGTAEPATGGARTRPLAARARTAPRLTAGWHEGERAAALAGHLDIYGPLPRRGHSADGALIRAVTEAGLTGRGGAAFSTGTKMRAVAARRGPAVVIANGMEGEPASEKDQALLSRSPHLVLDGAAVAAEAVGAHAVHLCLPRARRWLTELIITALAERDRAGLDRVPVHVHELPDRYVSSEETSLVRWLNGGPALPVTTPPRPADKGVRRRPTLVDNVETLAHVALIARYGPAWFREAGLPQAPGTMLATVSGAVEWPGVYEIELGTAIGDVLAMSGASEHAGAVLLGGYFGTWHDVGAVAGVPLTAGHLRRLQASPGAGVVIVLPAGACGLAETARALDYMAGQSAGQCGPCTFGLPSIAEDFAQLAACRPEGAVLDRLDRRFRAVSGRGACRHPDGVTRLAASALAAFRADAVAHIAHRRCLSPEPDGSGPPVLPIPRAAADDRWP